MRLHDEALPPLQAGETHADWLVIGGGIVGLCAAWRLRQAGHPVMLIDRSGIAAEASRGNAGALAYSDILPLASPGIVRQAPRWLMDPLGPLSLPPRHLPHILPWLWRFWRASQPARVVASTVAQVALMQRAAEAMPRLMASVYANDLLHTDGNLHLYESHAEWKASLPGWALRAQHGIAFEHGLDATALAQWQPGLAPTLVAGTFVPGWQRVNDPLLLARAVAGALAHAGGRLRQAQAAALVPQGDGLRVKLQGGQTLQAARVLVAAGAWSHHLARALGDRLPLETERGYNTTLPPGAFDLRRQLTFPGHGFVVTPIAGGVRVGGAVELGGLKLPPDYRRSQVLLNKASRFLPGLKTEGGTAWMGYRPSMPDSLPVIGAAPSDGRVLYAFGHGHLGLTQSAATAELIVDLAAGRTPALDLRPFSPSRF